MTGVPVNRFKAALREPAIQVGLWLSLGSAITAEIGATAGFDWLLADGEHGPNDVLTITEQLRTVGPYPVSLVPRARAGTAASIGPQLDAGLQTIMVPKVESASQAKANVRQLRYPPAGDRGVAGGSVRASRWGAIGDYLDHAAEQLALIFQIETPRGLANLSSLAGVDGVGGIFIGPNDLAASLGHPGEPSHHDVEAAIAHAVSTLASAGTPTEILVRNAADGARYSALGCNFIAVGSDAGTLASGLRRLAGAARAAMTGPESSR